MGLWWLVGGLEHFLFFHILGISSSQLTFIFFRGVAQPPTSTGFLGATGQCSFESLNQKHDKTWKDLCNSEARSVYPDRSPHMPWVVYLEIRIHLGRRLLHLGFTLRFCTCASLASFFTSKLLITILMITRHFLDTARSNSTFFNFVYQKLFYFFSFFCFLVLHWVPAEVWLHTDFDPQPGSSHEHGILVLLQLFFTGPAPRFLR